MEKLKVINRALSATANRTVDMLRDGSAEGLAAEFAFDRAVDFLLSEHDWPFQTRLAGLQRLGDSELSPFRNKFAYPQEAWHLRSVLLEQTGTPVEYRLVGNEIHAFQDAGLNAYYVEQPPPSGSDSAWHASATEVLTLFVEVFILRDLNEDYAEAAAREQAALLRLPRAAARTDQQSSPRDAFQSKVRKARRRKFGQGTSSRRYR